MSEPSRIRAQVQGATTVVRVRVAHEMESGQRKDAAGKPVPAWHVTEFQVALNGRPVLTAQWGTAVSKNPFVQFNLRGAKAGDKVTVAWVDNRGARRSDDTLVV
jgi:sulfur-oxidizing protein SoxZ